MTNTTAGMSAFTIQLHDGVAHYLGDTFVVVQRDETKRRSLLQNVVLGHRDLEALRAPEAGLQIALEDGEAHSMGDGLFVVLQADRTRRGHPVQKVVVSANDAGAMLALAA